MQVFKLFYQILRRYLGFVLFAVFLVATMALPIAKQAINEETSSINIEPLKIGLVQNDPNHIISQAFVTYLKQENDVQLLADDPELIADQLYTEKVTTVFIVPKGFGEATMHDKKSAKITQDNSNNPENAMIARQLVDNFMTNLKIQKASLSEQPNQAELEHFTNRLIKSLQTTITHSSEVSKIPSEQKIYASRYEPFTGYNYMVAFLYAFLSIFSVMNQSEIIKRRRLSIYPTWRYNLEIFLACVFFACGIWGFVQGLGLWQLGTSIFDGKLGFWLLIGSIVNVSGIVSLSYFVANLFPVKSLSNAIQSLLPLLIAFGSGLFVPLEFVAKPLQYAVSFATPIWNLKMNQELINSHYLTTIDWHKIYYYLLVQILLTIAYFMMSLVIRRYRINTHIESQ